MTQLPPRTGPVTPWNPSRSATARVRNPLPAPTICPHCAAGVELVGNERIYGRPFGDWPWSFLCTGCGAYVGAPRVAEGYRVLLDDECWAASADLQDYESMLLADAQRAGRFVIPCSAPGCSRPAVRVDDKWPYCDERNACREHHAGADLPEAA